MNDIPNPYATEPMRKPSPGERAQVYAGYIEDLARILGMKLNHDALAIIVGNVMAWWRGPSWLHALWDRRKRANPPR
jgi:hypothetical protein